MRHAALRKDLVLVLVVLQQVVVSWGSPAEADFHQGQQQQQTYSFQPNFPHAIPSVAIIGTAKAGTTDLYTLLRQTSHAVKPSHKRIKEAKMLIEDGHTVLPGHADFDEYLQRTGHPCGSNSSSSSSGNMTADAFDLCIQQLALKYQQATANSTSSSNKAQQHTAPGQNASGRMPLSIDGTTFYLALPRAVRALQAISNDTKIIVMLRHPVDRAESLYNHRVNTERNSFLPARVMNRTINEWAGMFLTWVDNTPRVKPLLEALGQEQRPDQQAELYQDLLDLNILGLPDGPLSFSNYNRHGHAGRNIFGSALYAAALSAWRVGYFKPGRVMIVDSHEFFARRLEVMNDVYTFVHGYPLSEAGKHIAQRTAIQNARRARGVEFAGAKLNAATKQRLESFYQPHNDLLLHDVLPALQRDGGWVVGFDKAPWVSVQQH